jgi:hypothetical protein
MSHLIKRGDAMVQIIVPNFVVLSEYKYDKKSCKETTPEIKKSCKETKSEIKKSECK